MSSTRTRPLLGIGAALLAVSVLVAVGSALRPTESAAPSALETPDPGDVYDPVRAGEELPSGYRPLLDRDQIRPVYDPQFVAAAAVEWPADMLVIGVAGDDAAKAYPVTHLNSREMVIDSLEGIPILVTW